MKVAIGTLSLLLAFTVALIGFALGQGERDILSSFLTVAGVLAVAAFALFGWSAVAWYQRTKVSAAIGATATTATTEPLPGAVSTVLLVAGIVLGLVGLPMLIGGVRRLTGSGPYSSAYGQELRSIGYPAAEWPWLFAAGLGLTVSALAWKVRLRRARGGRATSV